MNQLLTSSDFQITELYFNPAAVVKNGIRIGCPLAGNDWILEDFSGIAMSTNEDRVYTLTHFEGVGIIFIEVAFNSTNMLIGNVFSPSVETDRSCHLFYHKEIVYGIFHTTKEDKYILFHYYATNNTFSNIYYETTVDYIRIFINSDEK